jgi:hypothetical protein
VEAPPAHPDQELPDAPRQIPAAARVLRREALVVMIVADQDDICAEVLERL